MDLGDGGRGQRRLGEFRKHRAQRLAEPRLQSWPEPWRADRPGRPFASGPVSRATSGSDQIGPRAEHLAELDERGAQFREGQAHALFDFEIGDMLPVNALNVLLDPCEVQPLDPIGQAVLCQHAIISPPRWTFRSNRDNAVSFISGRTLTYVVAFG